ncbi:Uncharacterised protein [Vibrio cholerae]|nr:Uncharacterised protein [Vibrio cholerae]
MEIFFTDRVGPSAQFIAPSLCFWNGLRLNNRYLSDRFLDAGFYRNFTLCLSIHRLWFEIVFNNTLWRLDVRLNIAGFDFPLLDLFNNAAGLNNGVDFSDFCRVFFENLFQIQIGYWITRFQLTEQTLHIFKIRQLKLFNFCIKITFIWHRLDGRSHLPHRFRLESGLKFGRFFIQ